MNDARRIVTRLPLESLWKEGRAVGQRERSLTAVEIGELLRLGPIEFVVADVGHALQWIPSDACFRFWKDEGKPRLSPCDDHFYWASHWGLNAAGQPIVVLEKWH